MDCGAGPHTKNNGPPEEARIAYRREAEAHRRRNPAKGIQHRSVARLAGLVLRSLVRVNTAQPRPVLIGHLLDAFASMHALSRAAHSANDLGFVARGFGDHRY